MTTFAFDGFAFKASDASETFLERAPVSFTITGDSDASFSHQYINNNDYSDTRLTLSGIDRLEASDREGLNLLHGDADTYLSEMRTANGLTQMLMIEVPGAANIFTFYAFRIGGAELPASTADFEAALIDSTNEGRIRSGAFAPGRQIELRELVGGTIEETMPTRPLVIEGNGTSELLTGGTAYDEIDGKGGNDTLVGHDGVDELFGGSGTNTLSYRLEALENPDARGVRVDLTEGDAIDTYGNAEYVGQVMVVDGTPLADTFIADIGGHGYFRGLGGADTIQGKGGLDEADYSQDAANGGRGGIVADLTAGLITDGFGAVDKVSSVEVVRGTGQSDTMRGSSGRDELIGNGGNDLLDGQAGDDRLSGGDGTDTIHGGGGDDFIFGGATAADLADRIFAGAGNDRIDAGYGNDLVFAGQGNDTVEGGFGSDTLQGQQGDDQISGSALSDQIFGNDGADFINGGFGHDRLNGGAGADRFFHLGVAHHGSDWVQDYDAAEGDVLVFGAAASRAQFQINRTSASGAGDPAVDDAYVIYRPTGQIMWALVDGGLQDSINLQIGGRVFDLLE